MDRDTRWGQFDLPLEQLVRARILARGLIPVNRVGQNFLTVSVRSHRFSI
ncbi:hypothetical protein LG3211_2474 [Lysobacter gummosus]|nr:hypothetical protein LG3211_2474 [Lysobacter gummosus]